MNRMLEMLYRISFYPFCAIPGFQEILIRQSHKSIFTKSDVYPEFAFANYDCIMSLADWHMNLLLHIQTTSLKPPLFRSVGRGEIATDKVIFEIHLNIFFCMCLTELKLEKKIILPLFTLSKKLPFNFLVYVTKYVTFQSLS